MCSVIAVNMSEWWKRQVTANRFVSEGFEMWSSVSLPFRQTKCDFCVCVSPPQECTGCPSVPERAPRCVISFVKLWIAAPILSSFKNSKLPFDHPSDELMGLVFLAFWTVALTGCFGCQPGAGAVLARPLKWRPIQEAQPLPGRHQPGEGQYAV